MNLVAGADERAKTLGFNPKYCGMKLEDEGIFMNQYTWWRDSMLRGLAKEQAVGEASHGK